MNAWNLYQFGNVVNSFLDGCDIDMKEAIEERLDLLSEMGNLCKMPISEPLGSGLFALRVKENRQQVRLIYCFSTNRGIYVVHAFYKTTRKILAKDMDAAKRNKKYLQEKKGVIYEIDFAN